MNNGIQQSINFPGRFYVADSMDKAINMYTFDRSMMSFTKMNSIKMEDSPDNIHVDPSTKQYYIATVSKVSDFM